VIESTDRFNRENPHIVKNFLRGFIEGLRYIAIHKDESKKTITRYLKTSDPDILEATYGSFMQVTNYNAVPTWRVSATPSTKWGSEFRQRRSRMPQEFVDLRFLNGLQREGFFQAIE